mmetsp:Transcript_27767/g.84764  ORF Transcript_27767/g.84764 Transcript_27767/m.84764 type:complete len:216 (+) Transcript_27767:727-1374(+)|eukprot:scaffold77367_cov31-Tisochrysis_lutea.AAC.2
MCSRSERICSRRLTALPGRVEEAAAVPVAKAAVAAARAARRAAAPAPASAMPIEAALTVGVARAATDAAVARAATGVARATGVGAAAEVVDVAGARAAQTVLRRCRSRSPERAGCPARKRHGDFHRVYENDRGAEARVTSALERCCAFNTITRTYLLLETRETYVRGMDDIDQRSTFELWATSRAEDEISSSPTPTQDAHRPCRHRPIFSGDRAT